ncbi:hypothetical protein J7E99_08985 [Streptomyces sp. ISL-44]|uniref:hypothetical protein n=1 Tax=Streptomyces sp. ISL-44 TaxID=2819184 RepID=UPI001BE6680D|nr:hypothetical protein [Streptomyces sp. ISL-44]MBT2540833.1 hypothetical protein [Streptomyces sp. ISL-44]
MVERLVRQGPRGDQGREAVTDDPALCREFERVGIGAETAGLLGSFDRVNQAVQRCVRGLGVFEFKPASNMIR